MAKTAVINRRRRSHKRRRRNYGAAAANPRRRRHHRRGRRRNPTTPYSAGGYRRTPNPGMFTFDDLIHIVPSGTLGVWGARFALKQSGSFGKEPGVWQAVALWIGAHLTGSIVGSMFGHDKGMIAKIGALSYGGDMFARTRLFQGSDWIEKNLSLAGDDDGTEDYEDQMIEGFQDQSALGNDGGWALSGMGAAGDLVRDQQGNLYQLSGGMGLDSGPGSGSRLAGFQTQSALGGMRANPNAHTSFGYAP
jgi:hypothetical protein